MILARLLSATPQTDGEHWDLQFRWHYDEWHTDAYGQNPTPYQRNPQLGMPVRPPYPWRPGGIKANSASALAGKYGFTTKINTNNSPPTLDIYGSPPVNASPSGFAPQCPLQANVSTTGGNISSGTYLIAISANVNGPVSPFFILAVVPSGTTTATITISGCVWQAAAPNIEVFVGTSSLTMHSIVNPASWTGSSADGYGNPTVFTITAIDPDGIGLPDPAFGAFLFRAKNIVHGGVWGSAASSVGSSGGYATATFAGASWTSNQWAGYTLSRYDAGPFGLTGTDYVVASNTTNTLTFVSLHGPPAGVAVVMRANGSAATRTITANSIGDGNFVNSFAPSGLTVNGDAGNLIRIIAGTGAGQPAQLIASNTATVFTIAGTWATTPDATSFYIVEAPHWQYSIQTSPLTTGGSYSLGVPLGSIPIVNFLYGSLLVQAVTLDANGKPSVERYAPIQEIFVPPMANTILNPGYFTITPVSGVAQIDLANGLTQRIVIPTPAATLSIPAPKFTGGTIAPGLSFNLWFDTPASTNFETPTFAAGAGAFASDTNARYTATPLASVRDKMTFDFHDTGVWGLHGDPAKNGAQS
jgi:hypothetical protein